MTIQFTKILTTGEDFQSTSCMLCPECICQTLNLTFSLDVKISLTAILFIVHVLYFPAGFNPVHLVVRQTNGVDAFPTDEHPDRDLSPELVLEETLLSNAPDDFVHLSEDSPASPGVLSNEGADTDSSVLSDEGDAFSKDIGVQCDLVDVLAMLAEYQGNANDEDMPWFVSAMNMQRDDTGACYVINQNYY